MRSFYVSMAQMEWLKKIRRQLLYISIAQTELFDEKYYRKQCGDPKAGIEHYMEIGWKKGFDPSPAFSTGKYLKAYPDVVGAGLNPLYHFYLHGRNEGRMAGLKDPAQFVENYSILEIKLNPFFYFLLLVRTRLSGLFDARWYRAQYGVSKHPFLHYIHQGYLEGHDPSPWFNSAEYRSFHHLSETSKVVPLLHYQLLGKKNGLFHGVRPVKKIRRSHYFDEHWYRKTYHIPDGVDAAEHYLYQGWKLWYHPSREFSGLRYYFNHYEELRDEREYNPLMHYELTHRRKCPCYPPEPIEPGLSRRTIAGYKEIQDRQITEQYPKDTDKLIVYLVPERDAVGGGVMSICSIAQVTASIKEVKEYAVLVATVPSVNTFPRYTKFVSPFDVFRFEQIPKYFTELKEIIIHIPEAFVVRFMMKLKPEEWVWLRKLPKVRINILNQNMDYVPRPSVIRTLQENIPELTMTCAHRQYTTAQLRTSYNMPVHLFSTSNLVAYKYVPYSEKKNLLLYSPDYTDAKPFVLEKLRENFPDMECREIRDLSYQDYLAAIADAKWMITFGEGIDGYFSESLRCGAIPFAVQNPTFFSDAYEGLENIYASYDEMLLRIVEDIKRLSKPSQFTALSDKLRKIDAREYDDRAYRENIQAYYRGEYTFPTELILEERRRRLDEQPLISICMAVYNGEKYLKKQLDSIASLTYPNIELIVSDDGSEDRTMALLRAFSPPFPYTVLKNKGKHGVSENFSNALKYAKGEYIALSDQDDIWCPDKLQRLLERIDGFDIVHGGIALIDGLGFPHSSDAIRAAYLVDKTVYYRPIQFFSENKVLGCTCLMRSEFVRAAMPIPKGFIYHDWWFVMNAVCKGKGVCYIDDSVIQYRQHETNTASTTFFSKDFPDKMFKTLKIIKRNFGGELKAYELQCLETEINTWRLKIFANRYTPAYVNEYYDANRGRLTVSALKEMRAAIDEALGE